MRKYINITDEQLIKKLEKLKELHNLKDLKLLEYLINKEYAEVVLLKKISYTQECTTETPSFDLPVIKPEKELTAEDVFQ